MLISTGFPWESKVGYSRAMLVNNTLYISGTAGNGPDLYTQTRDAFATVEKALVDNGYTLSDVVQSRLSVADLEHWQDAARADGKVYGLVRPAFSLIHALPFVEDSSLVEVEPVAVKARS